MDKNTYSKDHPIYQTNSPKKYCESCKNIVDANCLVCPKCGKQIENKIAQNKTQLTPQTNSQKKYCEFCKSIVDANCSVCPKCGKQIASKITYNKSRPIYRASSTKKYCRFCGNIIDSDCVVCPKCGKQIEILKNENSKMSQNIIINNSNSNKNIIHNSGSNYPHKKKITTFFLCLFFGVFGIHHFYVGKIKMGILYLLTGGLLGIGWVVDMVLILIGFFHDSAGMPLV